MSARWTFPTPALLAALLLACTPDAPSEPAPPAEAPRAPAPPVPQAPAEAPAPAPAAPPADPTDGLNRGDTAVDFVGRKVWGGKGDMRLFDHVGPSPKTAKEGAIVAFGASWCGYCQASLATLKTLHTENPTLQIFYVGTDESEAGWEEEIAKFEAEKLPFPLLRVEDTQALVQAYFGEKRNIPRFYLIDHAGIVRIKDQGFTEKKMGKLLPRQVSYLLGLARPSTPDTQDEPVKG